MARKKSTQSSRRLRAAIRRKADKLAPRVDLPREVVFEVLLRTACDGDGEYLFDTNKVRRPLRHKAGAGNVESRDIRFEPDLFEVLMYLSPDEAAHLLESEDPGQLATSVNLADYLSEESTPLYNLPGLEALIERFLEHLDLNRNHLLKTGFPLRPFVSSSWLDQVLGYLYFVKLPIDEALQWSMKSGLHIEYTWPDKPAQRLRVPEQEYDIVWRGPYAFLRGQDGVYLTPSRETVAPCDYDHAALIPGTTVEDAQRIEGDRWRLHEVKTKVLSETLKALKERSAAGLLDRGIEILRTALDDRELEFYIERDCVHLGVDVRTGMVVADEALNLAGGVTDLLFVLGHLEEELTVGLFEKTHVALGQLVRKTPVRRLPESRMEFEEYLIRMDLPEGNLRSFERYYAAVGSPSHRQLDSGIETFLSLRDDADASWESTRKRLEEVLGEGGWADVVIRQRVPRRHREQYENLMRSQSELLVAQSGMHVAHLPTQQTDKGLVHSPDFRTVWLGDRRFDLTTRQAQVIEWLWHAEGAGQRMPIHEAYVLVELGFESKRLWDLFRSRPTAWKYLLAHPKRGFVALNREYSENTQ